MPNSCFTLYTKGILFPGEKQALITGGQLSMVSQYNVSLRECTYNLFSSSEKFTLKLNILSQFTLLAAQSSSRSLVVDRSVGQLLGWSQTFVRKSPLEYQMVPATYLPSYLCDSSNSSDISDSSDSSNSSDCDQTTFSLKIFWHQKTFCTKKLFSTKYFLTKNLFAR